MIAKLQKFSIIRNSNIVPDLGLKTPDTLIHHSLKNKNPIVNAIFTYQDLPSIF